MCEVYQALQEHDVIFEHPLNSLCSNRVMPLVQNMELLTARIQKVVRKALQTEQPALHGELTRRDQKGEAPLSETSMPGLRGGISVLHYEITMRGSSCSVRQQLFALHRGLKGADPTSTRGPHTCLSAACNILEYEVNSALPSSCQGTQLTRDDAAGQRLKRLQIPKLGQAKLSGRPKTQRNAQRDPHMRQTAVQEARMQRGKHPEPLWAAGMP